MGKKAKGGAAHRAKKRARNAAREITEQQASEVETAHVTKRSDEALFVLDSSAGDGVAIEKDFLADQKRLKRQKKEVPTEADEKKIQQLLDEHQHDGAKLRKLAESARTEAVRVKKTRSVMGNVRPKYDLWASPGQEDGKDPSNGAATTALAASSSKDKKKKKNVPKPGIGMSLAGTAPAHVPNYRTRKAAAKPKRSAIAVDVAHSGQSYHPDPSKHQDIIGEALALELRRKEADDYNKTSVSQGMSEETKALLIRSDDEHDSDDDDDDDDEHDKNGDGSLGPLSQLTKRPEKLTKAQRNKQKRHRALETEIKERKRSKKLLNSVSELKRYQRELRKKDETDKARREFIKEQKQEAERKPLGTNLWQSMSQQDPVETPALPVALTEELQSSLRSIKPKGSLLTDRLASYRDRKMADPKQVGDRKKVVQGKRRGRGMNRKLQKAPAKPKQDDYLTVV